MQLLEDKDRIYIVMEYLVHGDLKDFIMNQNGLTYTQILHILKQLLDALYYLHDTMNIVHRDLKPENIFVEEFDHKK